MLPIRFVLNLFVFTTLISLGVARLLWEGFGGPALVSSGASDEVESPALRRLRVSAVSLRSRPSYEELELAACEEKG